MPPGLLYRCHCLIFLMAFSGTVLHSQVIFLSEKEFYEIKDRLERSAGPDFNLLNGRHYTLPYSGVSHPYFNSGSYRPGSLRLNGVDYDSVLINYDIYNQEVILEHTVNAGRTWKVILNAEMIDHFIIDGKFFRKMSFPGTGTKFFQVVSAGEISCYLLWEKKLFRTSTSSNTPFRYSNRSRRIYLHREGTLHFIKGRSSLLSMFDEASGKEIRIFLRREKIRLGNASDKRLVELMNFCNDLMENG